MNIRFMSIGSGSCGNCYYLGVDDYGILIDAGIPSKTIRAALKKEGVAFESICAVFVTHDHADHIKSLGVIAAKANIPVYATKEVHKGINNNYCMHNGTDNVGYFIEVGDTNFCIATDLGCITDTVSYYLEQAHHLVIESNYEEEMLKMGRYPQFLKDRVSGMTGHLSNQTTARYLAKNLNEHLKNIWLCHLSEENNHPELAYKAVEMEFAQYGIIAGKDVKLYVLKRATPSQMFILE